jgi:hypothetical protein
LTRFGLNQFTHHLRFTWGIRCRFPF